MKARLLTKCDCVREIYVGDPLPEYIDVPIKLGEEFGEVEYRRFKKAAEEVEHYPRFRYYFEE